MSGRSSKKVTLQQDEAASVVDPAGLPAWITPELIEETVKVWQPYYQSQLAAGDAVEILTSVGYLLSALGSRENNLNTSSDLS